MLSWVDPRDEVAFGAWFAVMEAAARHGRDAALVWGRAELRAHLVEDDEDEDHLIAAARIGGAVVGTGSIDVPLSENLDSASVDVNVAPATRGRGIGNAILTFLEEEATRRGRTRLEGETVVVGGVPRGRAPGVRFAARHAFAVANTEDHLVLALPAALGEVLDPPGGLRPGGLAGPRSWRACRGLRADALRAQRRRPQRGARPRTGGVGTWRGCARGSGVRSPRAGPCWSAPR